MNLTFRDICNNGSFFYFFKSFLQFITSNLYIKSFPAIPDVEAVEMYSSWREKEKTS